MAVFKNSTASTTRSAAIMATYQARLGAMTKPTGTASAKAIASSRTAASVLMPSTIPRSEFLVALKIRITARRDELYGSAGPARVAAQDADDYSAARYSERSAARLAHQSGGLGVPSSNLGAPTILPGGIVARQCSVDQPAAGDEFIQHEPQRVFGGPAGLSGRPRRSARHNRRFAPLGRSRFAGAREQRQLRARFGNVFNETLGLIIRVRRRR